MQLLALIVAIAAGICGNAQAQDSCQAIEDIYSTLQEIRDFDHPIATRKIVAIHDAGIEHAKEVFRDAEATLTQSVADLVKEDSAADVKAFRDIELPEFFRNVHSSLAVKYVVIKEIFDRARDDTRQSLQLAIVEMAANVAECRSDVDEGQGIVYTLIANVQNDLARAKDDFNEVFAFSTKDVRANEGEVQQKVQQYFPDQAAQIFAVLGAKFRVTDKIRHDAVEEIDKISGELVAKLYDLLEY